MLIIHILYILYIYICHYKSKHVHVVLTLLTFDLKRQLCKEHHKIRSGFASYTGGIYCQLGHSMLPSPLGTPDHEYISLKACKGISWEFKVPPLKLPPKQIRPY